MTENIPDIQRYRRSKTKTQKPFRKLLKGIRREALNSTALKPSEPILIRRRAWYYRSKSQSPHSDP